MKNIGFDGSGENCYTTPVRYDIVEDKKVEVNPIPLKESKFAYTYLKRFYIYGNDSSLTTRIKVKLRDTFVMKLIKKIRR